MLASDGIEVAAQDDLVALAVGGQHNGAGVTAVSVGHSIRIEHCCATTGCNGSNVDVALGAGERDR